MKRSFRAGRLSTTTVFAWALSALACATGSGAPPARERVAEPLPAITGQTATLTAITVAAAEDGGTAVVLTADRPLRWTTFRDLDGHLILELPDTRATAQAPDAGGDPLVASVDLSQEATSFRGTPTTRLRIVTREDAVHALASAGTDLRLVFQPVAEPGGSWEARSRRAADRAETKPSAAPDPAPPPPAPAIETQTLDVSPVTVAPPPPVTKSSPVVARPIAPPAKTTGAREGSGLTATGRSVTAIETRREEDTVIVELSGDGPLPWESFRLPGPDRFVIDLPGVVNRAGTRLVPIGHPLALRARLAQFRAGDDPIARLVLDLGAEPVDVTVTRTETGLRIEIRQPR